MSTTVSLTFTTHCCCSYTDQWMGRNIHTSSSKKGTVHEWVSCLAIVVVSNSFTHIHNHLLLLIHRSMDRKGHAHQLWPEKSSSIKVPKWVSCLANIEDNNSFTHIHNPLLLLMNRSMDGKEHACKLWSHWPCYNNTVQAKGLCGSNPACEECLLFCMLTLVAWVNKTGQRSHLRTSNVLTAGESILDALLLACSG